MRHNIKKRWYLIIINYKILKNKIYKILNISHNNKKYIYNRAQHGSIPRSIYQLVIQSSIPSQTMHVYTSVCLTWVYPTVVFVFFSSVCL